MTRTIALLAALATVVFAAGAGANTGDTGTTIDATAPALAMLGIDKVELGVVGDGGSYTCTQGQGFGDYMVTDQGPWHYGWWTEYRCIPAAGSVAHWLGAAWSYNEGGGTYSPAAWVALSECNWC